MIEDEILSLVTEHYQPGTTSVLMLSNVGARLGNEGKWPLADDPRTLIEVAEKVNGITLVRDPDALSFIALVPIGQEELAHNAIANRKSRQFLRGLQRAVLFAFCLAVEDGQIVSLKLQPAPGYHVGSEVKSGYVLVDADLRMSGQSFENLDQLDASIVSALESKIRAWCERHSLTPESLVYRTRSTPQYLPMVPQKSGSSALERLYQAQVPEVASRLIIPIDIALILSRTQ